MIIALQQLIALLPLLIIGFIVVIAMLCIIWRRNYFFNATLTIIGLNLAIASLWLAIQNGPTDITLLIRIDNFSILYTGLVLISSLATGILTYSWLISYPGNREEFYLMLLLSTAGGILLTSANHLATLFLGIELISLPIFGMLGYVYHQKHFLESSIKYTLLSAVASSFLLLGIALIYAHTGQLSFIAIGQSLNDTLLRPTLLLVGFGMIIVTLGFKLSLVPFHLWTPDVYQGAPAPVSGFLATANKIAIFSVFIRLFLYVPLINNRAVQLVLTIISFTSILLGNIMAINQNDIKRILGYSSIAHFGYLLIGIIAVKMHTLSLEAIGIYLTGYLFSSIGAFGIISLMSQYYNGVNASALCTYRGLFWHKPFLSVILTVMMLSLAGIPITLGFIGKFYIVILGVNSHLNWLTGAMIIGSAIGLFYYLRIIINLYLSPSKNLYCNIPSNWALTSSGMVVIFAFLIVLLLGLYPQPLITLIQLSQPMIIEYPFFRKDAFFSL